MCTYVLKADNIGVVKLAHQINFLPNADFLACLPRQATHIFKDLQLLSKEIAIIIHTFDKKRQSRDVAVPQNCTVISSIHYEQILSKRMLLLRVKD